MPAPRHAPAFRIEAGPDPGLCLAAAVLAALALVAVLAGLAAQSSAATPIWLPSWAWGALALALLPMAAWLGWRSMRHGPQSLRWDGQGWWWACEAGETEHAVEPHVVIDLGGWLLLRLSMRSARLPRYLALSRGGCASQWPALRATVCLAPPRPARSGES